MELGSELIGQFKSNVEDILTPLHTDDVLLKFLRARNFDLKAAEENFRAVMSTLVMFGIDCILDNYIPNELCERYGSDCFLGFAKDGSAIRYISGRTDFLGFIYSVQAYDLYKYFCYVIESDLKTMRDHNLETGLNCKEITYILDFDGFSLVDSYHKCIIESGLDHFHQLQEFYPEIWRNIFIVNVPILYDKIYSIFKPILRDMLTRKIQVATKNSTKDLLLKYIDDDVLPAFLGGTRVDSKGDPNCREFVPMGGKIPDKYYLKNCSRHIEASDPGVQVALIGPRSVLNVPLIVKKAPARVRLEARAENGSISFAVLYKDFGADLENPELPSPDDFLDPHDEKANVRIAASKVKAQCHLAPIDGTGLLTKAGVYVSQFDNRSSWFGSRKIFYRITLLPGEQR